MGKKNKNKFNKNFAMITMLAMLLGDIFEVKSLNIKQDQFIKSSQIKQRNKLSNYLKIIAPVSLAVVLSDVLYFNFTQTERFLIRRYKHELGRRNLRREEFFRITEQFRPHIEAFKKTRRIPEEHIEFYKNLWKIYQRLSGDAGENSIFLTLNSFFAETEEEKSKLAEEARLAEESRLAEEARLAEEVRKAEESRLAEEARLTEEARKAEEARLAEEVRKAEEARERARLAEEARIERKRERAEKELRRIKSEVEKMELLVRETERELEIVKTLEKETIARKTLITEAGEIATSRGMGGHIIAVVIERAEKAITASKELREGLEELIRAVKEALAIAEVSTLYTVKIAIQKIRDVETKKKLIDQKRKDARSAITNRDFEARPLEKELKEIKVRSEKTRRAEEARKAEEARLAEEARKAEEELRRLKLDIEEYYKPNVIKIKQGLEETIALEKEAIVRKTLITKVAEIAESNGNRKSRMEEHITVTAIKKAEEAIIAVREFRELGEELTKLVIEGVAILAEASTKATLEEAREKLEEKNRCIGSKMDLIYQKRKAVGDAIAAREHSIIPLKTQLREVVRLAKE
ncbi:MAG: hypothetical protein LBK29_01240 [Oscillospiraceae bacterium]|jgi:hypothetical protein|nr:hypothetical protein [Oscillospiraceae bacterium]